jgi:hypothetical protein
MSKSKVRITSSRGYGDKEVVVYHSESPDYEAALAFSFIERWGMVTAVPDGEDSAGREKARLLTPSEVVDRAFMIAALALAEARKRDLMQTLPDLNEINAAQDKKRAKEEA